MMALYLDVIVMAYPKSYACVYEELSNHVDGRLVSRFLRSRQGTIGNLWTIITCLEILAIFLVIYFCLKKVNELFNLFEFGNYVD